MMFADLSTADPIHIKDFLLIIGFFISSAASAVAVINSRRVQRREVTFGQEFVTKDQCTIMNQSLDRRIRKIEEDVSMMRREVKQDMRGVHERIDQVLAAVSELRGELTAIMGGGVRK